MDVYPLLFRPIFKSKIWGGRNLKRLLGKPLPQGEPIGESWEIADLEDDQSVVVNGPSAGKTLGELTREWGDDLIGGAALFEGRFPLLIKFLDATQTLSVQVHPDQAMANRLGGRVRVKNEAWYILEAEEDGFIYRGVRGGVDAEQFRAAIENQTVETLLNRVSVRKGHCYYLPSGTVHALGAGVTVAEVQTPSDITYRVYDFNRVEPATGRPRDLHVDEAMECISFDTGPIAGEVREHTASVWMAVSRLVNCESFVIERVRMVDGVEHAMPGGGMVIWIVLEGRGTIAHGGPGTAVDFGVGDTVLVPAGLKDGRVTTRENCLWLEVTIPVASSLAGFPRPDRDALADSSQAGGRYVPLNVKGEPPPA